MRRLPWLAVLLGSATAAAQAPVVDLTQLDRGMVGPRAQVAVLGTLHLRSLGKAFKASSLDPLLDRLAAFKPEVVTVEQLPGEGCDQAARYGQDFGPYCQSTAAARAATGLDVPAAVAELQRALAGLAAHPSAAQRRRLAALFLAANDRASALVQWLQLPEAEQRPGEGLDEALVGALRELELAADESFQVGARLAARLGLQRVYPVDDHSGDDLDVADAKAFGQALQQAWDADARGKALNGRVKALSEGPDLLPAYRLLNEPATLKIQAEVNVQAALRSTSPQRYPAMWVAGWETRNLRMVANVRATFRTLPAARVLCIVGAAHKPWFDGWLGQLQGVDLADMGRLLR